VEQGAGQDNPPTGILLVDADEVRAQRVARALALANYHLLVATTLYQGFQRSLAEPADLRALVLGHIDWDNSANEFLLNRLVQRLAARGATRLPTLVFPSRVLTPPALLARQDVALVHLPSGEPEHVLAALRRILPSI
jgi:hypothetical protein